MGKYIWEICNTTVNCRGRGWSVTKGGWEKHLTRDTHVIMLFEVILKIERSKLVGRQVRRLMKMVYL